MYWRRRIAALVAVVLAVIVFFWVTARIFGGDDAPASAATKTSSSADAGSSASEGDGSSGSDASTSGASGSGVSGSAAAASGASDASASGAQQPSEPTPRTSAEPAPATEPAPAPAPPAPPAAPAVCEAAQIVVQAGIATSPIRSGDKPTLVLSVTNAGGTECLRNLNAANQELLVYAADGTRLWSSNDCYPESSDDTRLLAPGQKVDFSLVWAGKTSSPGCSTPRQTLGAGSYLLEAVQDGVVSERVPFTIEP